MKSTFASSVLSALLYTQCLLGFAGVSSIVMRELSPHEPVFVSGAVSVTPASSIW